MGRDNRLRQVRRIRARRLSSALQKRRRWLRRSGGLNQEGRSRNHDSGSKSAHGGKQHRVDNDSDHCKRPPL
jgi:hypothetical protein